MLSKLKDFNLLSTIGPSHESYWGLSGILARKHLNSSQVWSRRIFGRHQGLPLIAI
jgi:hypothetical protein